MSIVLRNSSPAARKDYECSACDWIINYGGDFTDFSFGERKAIIRAKRNKYQIKKGSIYLYQVNIWCGDFNIFRAIPEINDICLNHDIYEEY